MRQNNTPVASIRTFWANPQQRRTMMWIIGAFSVTLMVFGIYTIIDGHLTYRDRSAEIDEITAQIASVVEQYPLVERDGTLTRDLTSASDTDKQFLALLHTRERSTYNSRVDAENRRNGGVRLIGLGVIGLALAYFILPESEKQPESDDILQPD